MNRLVQQPLRCLVLALFLVPVLLGHGLHLLPGCEHEHLASVDPERQGNAHAAHHHDHGEACDHDHAPRSPLDLADEGDNAPPDDHQEAHDDCFICHWMAAGKSPYTPTTLAVETHRVAAAIVIQPHGDLSTCPRELLPRGPPLA